MGRGGAGGWRKTRRIQKIAVHPRAAPGAGRRLGLKIGRAGLVLPANRMERGHPSMHLCAYAHKQMDGARSGSFFSGAERLGWRA